ncbi:MAG: hypothetical protein OXN17_04675 [Candidatus Poribacteria bacterium]|nr:hypothetical protein [Candidatus Poribacteria bacterium]
MAFIVAQLGCEKKIAHHSEQEGTLETQAHHEHTTPHGGTMVVLGEEFAHVEFVLEKGTGKLSAFGLDGEAEKPIRLTEKAIGFNINQLYSEQEFTLQLKTAANVLTERPKATHLNLKDNRTNLPELPNFMCKSRRLRLRGKPLPT